MYTQVQGYDAYSRPDAPGLPLLVEDDDGLRLLLFYDAIPIEVWTQALAAGAAGLVTAHGGHRFVPADFFAEHRTVNRFVQIYDLAERFWMPCGDELRGAPVVRLLQAWQARGGGASSFVHLHTHSEFSALDGLSTMAEIGAAVLADGQRAVGITDHGTCAGHPALQQMAVEIGINPVFGIEANFVPDRFAREDPLAYWHLTLWALDDEGLRNLWGLSTEGYRDGFYGRPRIDWDTLARFHPGLMAATACLRGPLLEPWRREEPDEALSNLSRLGTIFGERLYIEMHANAIPEQIEGNRWLADVARNYRVPMLAAVDSHYALPQHKDQHQVWLATTTSRDVADQTSLFGADQAYHLMGEHEVRTALSYLPEDVVEEAVLNTGKAAEQCTARLHKSDVKPVFSRPTAQHPDPVAHDVERFLDLAYGNWDERVTSRVEDEAPYLEQAQTEGGLLIEKGFPGYYLICADYVTWAKDHGILVGPGRGSGAASLYAYLLRIIEIDPIEGQLNLDRFMTKGRKSLPDFDIDFPSSKAEDVIGYVQQRWGAEHVARVGSHLRMQNKSAFRDVQRAIASRLPPESYGAVTLINKMVEAAEGDTAGLGLSWDDLMAQIGDMLGPIKEKMPELFDLAALMRGRLKTYGSHAAGFIIDPDANLEHELPMRRGSGEGAPMVTQFDMDALEYLGKVKFDLLMIRNLDTVQDTVDLIAAETGKQISPYGWVEEYDDPQVYEQLAQGWTMGVFQLGTNLGTRITKQLKPINRSQVADVTTIGRPGPLRSGLDKLYMRRRDGQEEITYADERLADVLDKTFGCFLYQEDIMAICRVLADYDADESDHVRKILGKKKIEEVEEEGRRFVARAIANGTDPEVARGIWVQMAEFARYSFNRAHAYSYATLALWTAWLKTHYPRQFLTAAMATVKKDRIPQFVVEARRLGYEVLPPDVNGSGIGFTATGLVVRYGLASMNGIGESVAGAVLVGQPYASFEDFMERKGAACNIGHVKKLVAIGAFDQLIPNRRSLEARLIDETTGVTERCTFKTDGQLNEHNLPCTFDWDSEPKKYGRSGKLLAASAQLKPPKRCTKACRNYSPPQAKDYSHLPPYGDAEIRDREVELLGVYLSSSPFDRVPEDVLAEMMTADDLAVAENGTWPVVAVVASSRPDQKGRDFGFVTLVTPSGEMSAIVFRKEWAKARERGHLRKGTLVFVALVKTDDDRYRVDTLLAVSEDKLLPVEEPPHATQAVPAGAS